MICLHQFDKMASTICPSAEELTKRLCATPGSFDYLEEKLYPKLVKELAGKKVTAMRILMVLQCAFHDFSIGMPPAALAFMNLKTQELIEALVPDATVAKEAIDLWNLVNARA